MSARNLWSPLAKAFIDVRVFNPQAKRVSLKCTRVGGGPTPITPETDQILPVGHGQEWARMVKNAFSLKEAS